MRALRLAALFLLPLFFLLLSGCKGQGLTKTTRKDCADKNGTVSEAKDEKDAKTAKGKAKGKAKAEESK